KLRRYLLGLSLIAAQAQNAYNLRQGCLLVQKPKSERTMQLVHPNGKRVGFECALSEAVEFTKGAARDFFGARPAVREFAFARSKVAAALTARSEEKTAKKG